MFFGGISPPLQLFTPLQQGNVEAHSFCLWTYDDGSQPGDSFHMDRPWTIDFWNRKDKNHQFSQGFRAFLTVSWASSGWDLGRIDHRNCSENILWEKIIHGLLVWLESSEHPMAVVYLSLDESDGFCISQMLQNSSWAENFCTTQIFGS